MTDSLDVAELKRRFNEERNDERLIHAEIYSRGSLEFSLSYAKSSTLLGGGALLFVPTAASFIEMSGSYLTASIVLFAVSILFSLLYHGIMHMYYDKKREFLLTEKIIIDIENFRSRHSDASFMSSLYKKAKESRGELLRLANRHSKMSNILILLQLSVFATGVVCLLTSASWKIQ